MTELDTMLRSLGVEITRVGDREISGRCPVHINRTGHEDRSPSWSINVHSGLWICYACGARGGLVHLVSEITGGEVNADTIGTFLMDAAVDQLVRRPATDDDLQETRPDWLDLYKFAIPPYTLLDKKQISEEAARFYSIRYDMETKALVTPIVSPDIELMGWQLKGPKGFFLNYPTGVKKSTTLFGIERFSASTAIIVESPLDVVRYASAFRGYQALSTFGAAVSEKQLALISRVADRVIIAMDNDSAGYDATYKISQSICPPRKGLLYINYHYTNAKDIGDMTDDEVEEAISKASIFPPWSPLHDLHQKPLLIPRGSQGKDARPRTGPRRYGDGRRQNRYNPRNDRRATRRW